MSTRQKSLTDLQKGIIDALANDYEGIGQIREMLDRPATDDQIQAALWELIQDGYVACFAPKKVEMKPVVTPGRQELGVYWFSLTKKGEQLLRVMESVK